MVNAMILGTSTDMVTAMASERCNKWVGTSNCSAVRHKLASRPDVIQFDDSMKIMKSCVHCAVDGAKVCTLKLLAEPPRVLLADCVFAVHSRLSEALWSCGAAFLKLPCPA